MKIKIVINPKGKAKKRATLATSKKVVQIKAKLPGIRHFRLIAHKHTGRLIHHRHTSHLTLLVILVIVGFFIYASGGVVKAETATGSVLVGVIVPSPPPEIGATITSPKDGDKFKNQNIINVSGTCFSNSFVIIKDNNIQVGSAACTADGLFSLQIQIEQGKNVLSALNYDNLNQAGPATSSVTVFGIKTVKTPTTTGLSMPLLPTIPDNPSIITGVNSTFLSCNDYRPDNLTIGGELHVAIVCIPRLFFPNMQQVMGLLVWGGTPPYAVSIDFGDNSESGPTLISLTSPSYNKIKFSYAVPNTYKIKFRVTDKANETAIVQTAVQVNGEVDSLISSITKKIFGDKQWFESPVPFYLLAVAITLGFWGGDIFDRKYGAKTQHRLKKARA